MAWMGQNSLVSPHVKQMASAYSTAATSPIASRASTLARSPGRLAMSPIGGYAVMGAVAAAMTYDPTQKRVESHFAQEGVKIGADLLFDTAAIGIGSLAGPLGTGIAIAGIMAMSFAGMSPGQAVGKVMDKAGEEYNRQVKRRPTPIKQNQRTMASMQKAMGLIGQTGRKHSMLGSEAQFMHN